MITIPDMIRLPNNCYECPFSFWDEESYEYWCPYQNCTVDCHGGNRMRLDDCPLVESEVLQKIRKEISDLKQGYMGSNCVKDDWLDCKSDVLEIIDKHINQTEGEDEE